MQTVETTTSSPNSTNALLAAGWISVNDRLPENSGWGNDTVLFWSKKHGFWMVGCYDYEFSNWTRQPWERGYESLSFDDVTYWMPLPERPPDCR